MNDVFDEQPANPAEEPSQGEPQQEPVQQEPAAAGAPPAPDTDKHVPLAALEAERKGRQDWKEKAIRFEEELRHLREQAQAQPQQPQERDPVMEAQVRLENLTLNASERLARKEYGTEVVDKAFQRLQQEFAKNPALHRQVMNAADPWDEVVQQGKRLIAMDEIGTDPLAYRQKLEAEIRASLQQPQQPAAPRIPGSLADARSAGARGATFTGPTPLADLFPN